MLLSPMLAKSSILSATLLFSLFAAFITCCGNKQERVSEALSMAKDNSKELQKVLQHYRGDSVKYRAAVYLIENMPGKFGTEHTITYKGKKYNPNEFTHEFGVTTYSLPSDLEFVDIEFKVDIFNIDALSLIKNIDLAFEARGRYWWCENLSEEDFFETVLPYRVLNEPLDNWREYYYNKYATIADSVASITHSVDSAVNILNGIIEKKYIQDADKLRGYMYTCEIEAFGGGTCMHLAVDAAHAMRALGIPVNVDILPYHGKINGGHAYNSFKDRKGALIYFSPYERPKDRDKWLAPLVLRASFNIEHVAYESGLIDVTQEYYPMFTGDFDSNDNVELNVFNRGTFHTIKQPLSLQKENLYRVVPGLLYFQLRLLSGGETPAGYPFYYDCEGVKREIIPSVSSERDIEVKLTDGTKTIAPRQDIKYNLLLWSDKGWRQIASTIACDTFPLIFRGVTADGLFLVQGQNTIERMQRPFLYTEGGQQMF